MGGYPATVNVYKFQRNTEIERLIRESVMPGDIAEVGGTEEVLALRQQNFKQARSDVYSVIWTGGGGFGDPLERDMESVRKDVVENMAVTPESARQVYGVVISNDTLDEAATAALRTQLRAARKSFPRDEALPCAPCAGSSCGRSPRTSPCAPIRSPPAGRANVGAVWLARMISARSPPTTSSPAPNWSLRWRLPIRTWETPSATSIPTPCSGSSSARLAVG